MNDCDVGQCPAGLFPGNLAHVKFCCLKTAVPARTLVPVKKPRTFRLALALALILNLAGSPMAWAHWLGDGADLASATAQATAENCHGQPAAAGEPAPAPDSMPCCSSGDCLCAAPPLIAALTAATIATQAPDIARGFTSTALPASPLDDPLRPPIR
jgi:hypothetical protein